MKGKEREAKKTLSVLELKTELHATREKRFKLLFKHRASGTGNPLELRNLRRDIARLETWVRERQEEAKR